MAALTAAYPVELTFLSIMMFIDPPEGQREDHMQMIKNLAKGPLYFIPKMYRANKNYYRKASRPEYGDAFNGFMGALADPNISQAHKDTIREELVERHIRKEKTIAPPQVNAIIQAMDGPRRLRGHTVRRLPETVTQQQYQAVQGLATRGYRFDPTAAANWENQERLRMQMLAERDRQLQDADRAAPLSVNIAKVLEISNESRKKEGLPPISLSGKINQFDKIAASKPFSRVLEYIENPPGAGTARKQMTTEVKSALYRNAAEIIKSIFEDADLRKEIFGKSVGGLAHCNNNVLEVFSNLSNLVERYSLLKDINQGKISLKQFEQKMAQKFRLETLENYVSQNLLADSTREAEFSGIQPEVALRLKSDLKEDLDLGNSVTKVWVPYWKPRENDVDNARQFVRDAIADPSRYKDFLNADPLWRDGIIAFAEKQRPKDALQINAFAKYNEFVPVTDTSVQRSATEQVEHRGAVLLHEEMEKLSEMYKPKGQIVWGENGEPDKFKTDNPEYQAFYDTWEQSNRNIQSSQDGVAWQFSSYVTPSLLDSATSFPRDGNFKPTFSLPERWDSTISKLQNDSVKIEAVETKKRLEEKTKELEDLSTQKQKLRSNHVDLKNLPSEQIKNNLAEMARRRLARAHNEDVGESPAHLQTEGMIQLGTIEMKTQKLRREIQNSKFRLSELDSNATPH